MFARRMLNDDYRDAPREWPRPDEGRRTGRSGEGLREAARALGRIAEALLRRHPR